MYVDMFVVLICIYVYRYMLQCGTSSTSSGGRVLVVCTQAGRVFCLSSELDLLQGTVLLAYFTDTNCLT